MGVLLTIDHDHVKRVVEARLEREGFIYDTPERRRLVNMRAGPRPMPGPGVHIVTHGEFAYG